MRIWLRMVSNEYFIFRKFQSQPYAHDFIAWHSLFIEAMAGVGWYKHRAQISAHDSTELAKLTFIVDNATNHLTQFCIVQRSTSMASVRQ